MTGSNEPGQRAVATRLLLWDVAGDGRRRGSTGVRDDQERIAVGTLLLDTPAGRQGERFTRLGPLDHDRPPGSDDALAASAVSTAATSLLATRTAGRGRPGRRGLPARARRRSGPTGERWKRTTVVEAGGGEVGVDRGFAGAVAGRRPPRVPRRATGPRSPGRRCPRRGRGRSRRGRARPSDENNASLRRSVVGRAPPFGATSLRPPALPAITRNATSQRYGAR